MGGFTSKPAEPSGVTVTPSAPNAEGSGWGKTALNVLGGLLLLYLGYLFFN
jgi:hypothetical protein